MLLFWLVAVYEANPVALQWIISVVPTLSAVACTFATFVGV